MNVIYYLSGFLLIAVIAAAIAGVIRPSLYKGVLKKFATRPWILLGAVLLFFTLGGVAAATEPASVKQERIEREQRAAHARQIEKEAHEARLKAEEESRNRETTKEETKTEAIAFTEQTTQDASLAKGQQRVTQEGQAGEKTITYAVTYKNGQEISRTVLSEATTKQPVTKVTAIGTYEAPKQSSSGSGYTNSQGNHVPSPSSNPAGATAQCRDGTYSYSQSRRGTCSHHGGVAKWL